MQTLDPRIQTRSWRWRRIVFFRHYNPTRSRAQNWNHRWYQKGKHVTFKQLHLRDIWTLTVMSQLWKTNVWNGTDGEAPTVVRVHRIRHRPINKNRGQIAVRCWGDTWEGWEYDCHQAPNLELQSTQDQRLHRIQSKTSDAAALSLPDL